MNTNITTDNYEAFLLEYMEGNLSPDEAEQLKAFVAAQGLDWNELTEELPHLEAPAVSHPDKKSLKKKGALVPLYVKIASAAAAAGLLLTVTLWPEKRLPTVAPIAELKPILPERIITSGEVTALPPRTFRFVQPKAERMTASAVPERNETTLVAQLEPLKPNALPSSAHVDEPDFEFLAYRMSTELAIAQINAHDLEDYEEDERDLSLIGRGIYRLTKGRHDSFLSLITSGLNTAKEEVNLAASDLALTAYYHADERIESVKENWKEKRNE